MKPKPLLLISLATSVVLSSGCHLFSKSKKPKDNPAIAASVEAEFRQRWVDRRTAELTGQGITAATARLQAENEFHEKYLYLKSEKK